MGGCSGRNTFSRIGWTSVDIDPVSGDYVLTDDLDGAYTCPSAGPCKHDDDYYALVKGDHEKFPSAHVFTKCETVTPVFVGSAPGIQGAVVAYLALLVGL